MPKFHATMNTAEAQDRMLLYISAVPNELARAVQQVADDAALIFAAHAPRGRTGAIGRGIRVISAQGRSSSGQFRTGRQFTVIASAKNKGFDYVGVSRFGHRVKFIRPSSDRQAQSVIATRKSLRRYGHLKKGERPALRIPTRSGGKPLFRNVVRGVIVRRDWAEAAQGEVNREMNSQATRLAHNLGRRFG